MSNNNTSRRRQATFKALAPMKDILSGLDHQRNPLSTVAVGEHFAAGIVSRSDKDLDQLLRTIHDKDQPIGEKMIAALFDAYEGLETRLTLVAEAIVRLRTMAGIATKTELSRMTRSPLPVTLRKREKERAP